MSRIRELREANGMTVRQLSWKTGIPPSTIYSYENGTRSISQVTLGRVVALARALNTDIVKIWEE